MISRTALGCLIASVVLGGFSHPRVFFGDGGGSAVFSLDDLFFNVQWAAFVFALIALGVSGAAWLNAGDARNSTNLWLPACSALMVAFLLTVGVPHPANKSEWRQRELGAAAFVRGMARSRKANAKPKKLTSETFSGEWRAIDGRTFTFTANSVTWRDASSSGEYNASTCQPFELHYLERDREVLQDLGLTWSKHAGALYDSTAADAKIPVAELTCGRSDHTTFIRASKDEVWRWTNATDLETIKSDGFVLRSTEAAK